MERLAAANGITEEKVMHIIKKCTSGRLLSIFGEPTVNVLKVNLILDGMLEE